MLRPFHSLESNAEWRTCPWCAALLHSRVTARFHKHKTPLPRLRNRVEMEHDVYCVDQAATTLPPTVVTITRPLTLTLSCLARMQTMQSTTNPRKKGTHALTIAWKGDKDGTANILDLKNAMQFNTHWQLTK